MRGGGRSGGGAGVSAQGRGGFEARGRQAGRSAPQSKLRVTGGEAGGRRLGAPRGIRPTAALVRQAIFDMLGPLVDGAAVIDLFAGSGALGIEALSRGADRALLIDQDEEAVRVMRRNLESLGLAERGRAARADVPRWLAANPTEVSEAGLVLLDPPYNDPILDRALEQLDTLAAAGTTVVAEHARRQALPNLSRLRPERERQYGDTAVTVLRAQ